MASQAKYLSCDRSVPGSTWSSIGGSPVCKRLPLPELEIGAPPESTTASGTSVRARTAKTLIGRRSKQGRRSVPCSLRTLPSVSAPMVDPGRYRGQTSRSEEREVSPIGLFAGARGHASCHGAFPAATAPGESHGHRRPRGSEWDDGPAPDQRGHEHPNGRAVESSRRLPPHGLNAPRYSG